MTWQRWDAAIKTSFCKGTDPSVEVTRVAEHAVDEKYWRTCHRLQSKPPLLMPSQCGNRKLCLEQAPAQVRVFGCQNADHPRVRGRRPKRASLARSDDTAFSQKGVPTVGLYTGAGAPKWEAEAKLFGGAAGRPFDPCYHRACDTTENIDQEVLEQNVRALVRVLRAVAIAAPALGAPAQKAGDPPDPRR
jgi:hypothetical protein